ncbi:hypothetical protein ACFL3Z_01390 [Gemmatimonadota bacterium]
MDPFLRRFGIAAVLLLGFVIAVNSLVDPYRLFPWNGIPAVRDYETKRGSRAYKSGQVAGGGYDFLILGSSRADVGYDPMQSVLVSSSAYNAALAGTSMFEALEVLDLATHHHPGLRTVLLGVDLVMFNEAVDFGEDNRISLLNPEMGRTARWVELLLSWEATEASMATVLSRARRERSIYSLQGWCQHISDRLGQIPVRSRFARSLATFAGPSGHYGAFSLDPEKLSSVDSALAMALRNDLVVRVVLSPIHATQMDLIHRMGRWEDFETMKESLLTSTLAAREKGLDVELWDFAGFGVPQTEVVPPDSVPEMVFFWENSHFKAELGNQVLAQVFGGVSGPGVLLSRENMDAWMARTREDHERWREEHPAESEWVATIAGGNGRPSGL